MRTFVMESFPHQLFPISQTVDIQREPIPSDEVGEYLRREFFLVEEFRVVGKDFSQEVSSKFGIISEYNDAPILLENEDSIIVLGDYPAQYFISCG